MESWVQEVLLPIVLAAIAAMYSGLTDIWCLPYDKAIQLIRERMCARDSESGTIVLHYMPHEMVGNYFMEVS